MRNAVAEETDQSQLSPERISYQGYGEVINVVETFPTRTLAERSGWPREQEQWIKRAA